MTDLTAASLVSATRALAATWRIEVVGLELMRALRARHHPRVSVLWHEHLLPLLWTNRGSQAVIMASRHPDGRRLAATSRRLGYDVADGSSSRGAVAVLRRALRVLRAGGEIAIAVDGPRGPARRAKPGAAFAAMRTRAVIVPVAAGATPAWRLRSWDRLLVPAPFAKVRIVYGEPLECAMAPTYAAGTRMVQDALERTARLAAC